MGGYSYSNWPKSVRNRCVIEFFVALFVLSLCPFDISVGVGASVIGLSQIYSYLSCKLHHPCGFHHIQACLISREEKEKIWLRPMTKALTPTTKLINPKWQQQSATKTSITSRTDFRRSVGVTAATLPVFSIITTSFDQGFLIKFQDPKHPYWPHC